MRIVIIIFSGLLALAAVAWQTGMPRDEIAFLIGVYTFAGLLIWGLVPMAMAPGAIITIRGMLARVRDGRPFDAAAARRACWVFRGNQEIRWLGRLLLLPGVHIPDDLLAGIENALPLLEVSAARRATWLRLLMLACMTAAAICRVVASMLHR